MLVKAKTQHLEPSTLRSWQRRPDSNGHVSHRRGAGLEPAALPLCYASTEVRAERLELSPVHVLSMPPLPAWATRALDARGGSRTRTETLFERATSAVWVTRALHRSRYGRGDSNPQEPPSEDGVSAICTTPACDAGGGSRTPNGHLSPRRPQRRAFAVTPHQPNFSGRLRGKGSNLHDLLQRQASSL